MFVCFASYLDMLSFPPKFNQLVSQQEVLSVELRKKSKYPIIFNLALITNVAQFSAKEC